jgi:hypothetical protein
VLTILASIKFTESAIQLLDIILSVIMLVVAII